MSDPVGYFLTFVAYGSWLHGDDRGSVDRRRNSSGTEREAPNVGLREWERLQVRGGSVQFDERWRFEIDAAIRERCEFAGWRLFALNVRTNHVHLALWAETSPERAMTSLKAWATRRLRSAKLVGVDGNVWARHGSTRYLWDESDIERACLYVIEGQGPELPMRPTRRAGQSTHITRPLAPARGSDSSPGPG